MSGRTTGDTELPVGPVWIAPTGRVVVAPLGDYVDRAPDVARGLTAGDEVGGFKLIETPGHSEGHVSFWRESDGTVVLGDVLVNMES
jgi:glyoxylase-like metal-dependent hydrolase (beta-lactamase superfamily II)